MPAPGPRILLIEDEESLARWIVRYLERCGYSVDVCPTGRGALARLEASGYDAVVADWSLPDLSGGELIAGIARLRPALPLVVASGHPRSALEVPPHAEFLQKPFGPDRLAAALSRVARASPAA